ncbi:hypothetical protein [Frankia canadensis]|nr:hypothetical protein [Frankia canadensis]
MSSSIHVVAFRSCLRPGFETATILHPSVADHTAALTPAIARAWL